MTDEKNANGSKGQQKRKVLVEVNNLVKYFPVRGGLLQRVQAWVKAVDNISFFIYEGESFGLVGESGCGKTTVGRTILRLIPSTSGEVKFDGQNLFDLDASALKKMRRNIQIIFQDPYSSLDPRMPVGESIAEGLRIHTKKNAQERYDIVVEMLTRVGMRADHARRYPHEFSGGQ
ncbi:MAG: ABC transporter ATP-binding protein, partial [Anaerolineales bacterium]|nr:ABC transporter ATP-binding protein [Anaerolineales bacterium]